MGPCDAEMILHSKDIRICEKLHLTEWENVFTNYTSDRLLRSQMYKELKRKLISRNQIIQLK